MKNRMSDVRDHLVARLEELGDPQCSADAVARARATAEIAREYTSTVKVEIDARRLAGLDNEIPEALRRAPTVPRLGEDS